MNWPYTTELIIFKINLQFGQILLYISPVLLQKQSLLISEETKVLNEAVFEISSLPLMDY